MVDDEEEGTIHCHKRGRKTTPTNSKLIKSRERNVNNATLSKMIGPD